jgi:hypothetical protein
MNLYTITLSGIYVRSTNTVHTFSKFQKVLTTEYTERQAFCPVVRIGSPPLTLNLRSQESIPLKRFVDSLRFYKFGLPPLGPRRETHSLAGEGWENPIPTKGQKLRYSMYTIISFYGFDICREVG